MEKGVVPVQLQDLPKTYKQPHLRYSAPIKLPVPLWQNLSPLCLARLTHTMDLLLFILLFIKKSAAGT